MLLQKIGRKCNSIGERKNVARFILLSYIIAVLAFTFVITESSSYAYSGLSESATYDHLMSQTFEYSDASTPAARTFENWAGALMRVVLPFMTIFGMLNMFISGAATVIYLSDAPFFDEVHYMHYMRRKKKTAGSSASKMKAWVETMNELGLYDGLLKGLIIPDVKAKAFYDALEIGEDGRPSIGTFFKNSFPKYMALMALILMINDRTLMNLYVKGGEVGLWFFKKAESYNYIEALERASNSGSKYDPGFKGGQKAIYKACENVLLSLDKSPGTETAQYKQSVGSRLANKLSNDVFTKLDFQSNRISPSAIASIEDVQSKGSEGGTITHSFNLGDEFGVKAANGEQFLILRLEVTEKRARVGDRLSSTTDKNGIEVSGGKITFTLSKTNKFGDNAIITNVGAVRLYDMGKKEIKLGDYKVSSDGKSITFEITGQNQGDLYGIGASLKIKENNRVSDYSFFFNSRDFAK